MQVRRRTASGARGVPTCALVESTTLSAGGTGSAVRGPMAPADATAAPDGLVPDAQSRVPARQFAARAASARPLLPAASVFRGSPAPTAASSAPARGPHSVRGTAVVATVLPATDAVCATPALRAPTAGSRAPEAPRTRASATVCATSRTGRARATCGGRVRRAGSARRAGLVRLATRHAWRAPPWAACVSARRTGPCQIAPASATAASGGRARATGRAPTATRATARAHATQAGAVRCALLRARG